ncbi:topology modulation protein [Salipaludibacillus sp. CF4.18]|uniref:topology modulation protein n=1 Tax=Salipaludibacillus sp. CF4.18 TaxID=3373081 RepID=UPI003EE6DFB0
MNRIMVMGVSAGVGKSMFARKLAQSLNIQVYHLDTIYWKPNWIEASLEEFSARQQEIVLLDSWIMEGNYNSTYSIRIAKADTIIYLELPLIICLYRVFKRWLTNIGKTRPDMGEGCKEKLDYQFLKFICTTYYPRKKMMKSKLQAFKEIDSENRVITLKSKKDIQSYLHSLNI